MQSVHSQHNGQKKKSRQHNGQKKHRQHNGQKKKHRQHKGVIRIRKPKDRQHNGQMEKDKMTTNDLQSANQKTKDRTTLTPLKTRLNSGATEGFAAMKKGPGSARYS